MADKSISDLCKFEPKQKEAAIAFATHKYTLAGGAAGGGKSYLLRWLALKSCLRRAKIDSIANGRVGIFCEDYPTLKDRQLSKIEFEFPEWLGDYSKTDHEYKIKKEYGGWTITFRNLDNISKYLSSEWADIFVDELTMNSREIFDFLNMRLRWVGVYNPKFIGATNPGGKGHAWVKKLWIEQDFTDENFDPKDFVFVPFKYKDNKYIDPSYEKQLDSLPDQLRKAYRDGDWDLFAGQFFSEWRRAKHIIKPFEIPEQWEIFAGLDYGYNAPSAVVFIAFDKAQKAYYLFDEIYGRGMTYTDLANKIISKGYKNLKYIIADPAIWAKKDSPQSGASMMESLLKPNDIILVHGDNDRKVGWGLIREILKDIPYYNGPNPSLRVFDECSNFIRTFPSLVYKENHVDDVDSDGDDHLGDALRYAISWHKKNKKDPSGNTIKTFDSDFDDESFNWHIKKEKFEEKEDSLFTFD